ncbi:MAG: stage III sporulation protein AC [Clostridiales bacterium]|nr:stage III sporulation protein AC [Clostridiales bacterium]
MDIDLVFRIAAFGIMISVINQLLKNAGREDIATLATLAGLVIAIMYVVGLMSDFFSSVRQMFSLY